MRDACHSVPIFIGFFGDLLDMLSLYSWMNYGRLSITFSVLYFLLLSSPSVYICFLLCNTGLAAPVTTGTSLDPSYLFRLIL